MKKILLTYLLLTTYIVAAQNSPQSSLPAYSSGLSFSMAEDDDLYEDNIEFTEKTFEEAAKKNNVPFRSMKDRFEAPDGYYAVVSIASDENNVAKAVKNLKRKGFNAGFVNNPQNGLKYIYIAYFPFGLEAIDAYMTQYNGKYSEDSWILELENASTDKTASTPALTNLTTTSTSPTANLDTISYAELSESEETATGSIKINDTKNKSKLIQKADYYFDKMWYAEAAEIYEEALAKGEKNYSYEVIQKAADAHYFNTNMEKAYEWYNVLYANYGEEMSADNIFKYAHSLKGTGKYARSKKLMRLYNNKMKKQDAIDLDVAEQAPNEVVLDELLANTKNFDIKNMAVNSEYSEFSPMFLDSTQVVFASSKDSSFLNTRRYKWNEQPFLDLYVAKMNEESQDLNDAVKFSKKINTKYHEAAVAFTPDNSTMYFTRNNYGKKLKRDKNGVNHLKIYVSKKIDGEWQEAIEVPFNSDNYSTGHPALSPDGKKMYFVSDMPGTIGETDIFVVDLHDDGSFSEPKNLGPQINTERREMFPFVNAKKIYFSSDGHTGLGGLDVYEALYSEEEGFGEVNNLGQPVNSNKDDFSYIVNEENQKGFFASNRDEGKGGDDIYSFKRLVAEEVPANSSSIAGVVTELITGKPIPKALIELLDENGIKLKEMVSDENGSFIFEDLEGDKKYTLKTTQDTYFENLQEVTTLVNDTVDVEIKMRKLVDMIAIEDGIKKLKTEMIFFDFDKSYIRQDASKELDKLVEVMTEYPDMVIKIESHTDSRGKREYNKYLSDRRAKATREYLISKGISPNRLESAIGYGEERLLNGCDGTIACTEKEHFLNRRSEFIIVKM